jgi:hypothetical protein
MGHENTAAEGCLQLADEKYALNPDAVIFKPTDIFTFSIKYGNEAA